MKLRKSGTDPTSVIEYHLSQLGIKIYDQNIFTVFHSWWVHANVSKANSLHFKNLNLNNTEALSD